MKFYNSFQGVFLYDKGWFESGRHYNINISAKELLKLHETFSHLWKKGNDFPLHFKAYLNSLEYESQYMYFFLQIFL